MKRSTTLPGPLRATLLGLTAAALLVFSGTSRAVPSSSRAPAQPSGTPRAVSLGTAAPASDDDDELRERLKSWLDRRAQEKPAACTERCFLLSALVVRGDVGKPLRFELTGQVLANETVKVPLFGSANQVRLEELTLNGGPATLGFDSGGYYVLTNAREFVVRGKLTLDQDATLQVTGPVNRFDATLGAGRVVEGAQLSGLENQSLHFDPMTAESQQKVPTTFRLSRALRIGKEISFTYRVAASQATPLEEVRVPLRFGEKVHEVSGAPGWSAQGGTLVLPSKDASIDVTVTGTMPKVPELRVDERSAYEWWLVEADPDHKLAFTGDAKIVETTQSPIQPTLPGARVFLIQRGQHVEVTSTSLVQGEVLAAVARKQSRFAAITRQGEVFGDETIRYDNNGLEHLLVQPAGQAIYLSIDGSPQRILHMEGNTRDVLVPMLPGGHTLRVQSIGATHLRNLVGWVDVPMPKHKLTTSDVEVTLGIPADVHPIAFFGGDRTRWAFAQADFVAALLGLFAAGFGLRTWMTRAVGSAATIGLWFISPFAFVCVITTLFCAGGIFVATRFLRGARLAIVSSVLVTASILGANASMQTAEHDPNRDVFVTPSLPTAETSYVAARQGMEGGRSEATPVSISLPRSDKYVYTSRQLVTSERPFAPTLFYVGTGVLSALKLGWLALVSYALYMHRAFVVLLMARVKDRLRRPAPGPSTDGVNAAVRF